LSWLPGARRILPGILSVRIGLVRILVARIVVSRLVTFSVLSFAVLIAHDFAPAALAVID